MAEFKEVMRQAERMCKAHDECECCPIKEEMDDLGEKCPFCGALDVAAVEQKIMDWAAEHPEPRYPSWHEAWKQLFPDRQRTPCPGCCGKKYAPEWCGQEECGECKNRPIPADIAEKLGIKPVGGDADA